MRNKFTILVFALILICSCQSSIETSIGLNTQEWIHGSEDCNENTDPAIQVVQYNSNTWILRQNKCTNYEAPFMFLFIGEEKALLMDTGATKSEAEFPLYKTVKTIISDWEAKHDKTIELVVAHTHKHGDHYAADAQFREKENTTLIGLEVDHLKTFFNISNWPEQIVDFDLGGRQMKIIPIPGHEASSIAIYDTETQFLLTGDTFYPGRLYVNDWSAFKKSINRLVEFSMSHDTTYILGNHIEMTQTPKKDYPIRTIYQPNEHPLPLNVNDLKELNGALIKLGNTPTKETHNSFIIYPVN